MQPTPAPNDTLQQTAVCPEHPERASVAPCERCGRFLCEACLASRTPPRCEPCDVRARDPLGLLALPFSIGGALSTGWKLFARTLPQILPISVLFGIFGGLITYAIEANGGKSNSADRIFDATVGLVSVGAYLALMVGVAEGAPRTLGSALKEGLGAWPRLFGARFRSGLLILLFTLLLVIPGIMKAVSLAVATEAAFREPNLDALDNSTQLTEGRRWEVFGLFVVCYAIVFLAVFPIGFVGSLIDELLPISGAVSSILIDAGIRLAEAYSCGVALAAFYGLKRSQGQELEPLPSSAG
ncbi:hypothetical protein [Archangium lansingense]|uniref:B box-type domain-containing protein n=1 Tax=Archangium lansingense TaxID=2995310 RepID=A0ABT4ABY3_9BACT|nr:hypothetical protein [Archangium lansinium]MCY1079193.1 hypothetical protein [Archangium lansinium]